VAKRSTPVGLVVQIVLSVPFLLVGLLGLGVGLLTLSVPGALVGLFFGGAGVLLIRNALRGRQTPESRAQRTPFGPLYVPHAIAPVAAYRQASPTTKRTAREAYALALPTMPIQVLPFARGRVLPFALRMDQTAGPWIGVAFGLIWTVVTTPFAIGSLQGGAPLAGLVIGAFAIGGFAIAFLCVRQLLSRRKLASVEIGAEPTFAGEELEIYVEQRGPARGVLLLNHFKAHIRCEERVTYTVGTDTRTESTVVFEHAVVDESAVNILAGETWSRHVRVAIPRELCSFKAPHNQVIWAIVLDADVSSWPDYKEAFVFRVVPPIGGAA
jgi:hypothetical protein